MFQGPGEICGVTGAPLHWATHPDTKAGPVMKNLLSWSTELAHRRQSPLTTKGAVCPQIRANTLFQALRKQDNAPEDQFAPSCPSFPAIQ